MLITSLHLLLILNALVRCAFSRFWIGLITAIFRIIVLAFESIIGGFSGSFTTSRITAITIVALGPMLSLGTLFLAYWRKKMPQHETKKHWIDHSQHGYRLHYWTAHSLL